MRKYSRIFNYLKAYKSKIVLYFFCIILSIIFSIVSFGMLAPFFDLIFKGDNSSLTKTIDNPAMEALRGMMVSQVGKLNPVGALALICVIIVVSIFLKNVFLYLSFYILNPLKNKIVNTLRSELYNKILQLPIGMSPDTRPGGQNSRGLQCAIFCQLFLLFSKS